MGKGQSQTATQGGSASGAAWYTLAVAALGALAVAAGLYETGMPYPLTALVIGLSLLAVGVWDAGRRMRADLEAYQYPALVAGPLLWVVGAWMIFRSTLFFSPNMILLPAAVIAWLVAVYPPRVFGAAFVVIILMEAGLTASGHQSVSGLGANLAAYGAAAVGLALFVSSKTHREKMKKALALAKREAESEEYARDLGLFDEKPVLLDSFPKTTAPGNPDGLSKPAVEIVSTALDSQLALLREALDLTTVALLWPDPEKREMRLRSIASRRHDIVQGPFAVGSGVLGALVGAQNEVSGSQEKGSLPSLPYYRGQEEVGGFLAIRIPENEAVPWVGFEGRRITAILCADRQPTGEWTEAERRVLRLASQKLAQDVLMGRKMQAMARERAAFHRVCIGLRELNSALGFGQVLEATSKAVNIVGPFDFMAISLLENGCHRIVRAQGAQTDSLLGREFPEQEGLVGQAIKINRTLPARAECHGPMPVFASTHRLSGYRSLLVVPLSKEEGKAMGALTLAAQEPGVFSQTRQDILRLIAAQVAVKIDLGQAHEQINKMASTDGLTGLANHRTFQHGFDIMLERAQRRSGPLCLILCDIDRFKRINDTHGHPFGDKVLRRVADILGKAVRTVDLAARYGGEEFAVVLEDSDGKGGGKMAERIRKEVELATFRAGREPLRVTVSLGLAVYPVDGDEKAVLIARADQALYRAKQQGRNRVVAWEAAGATETGMDSSTSC